MNPGITHDEMIGAQKEDEKTTNRNRRRVEDGMDAGGEKAWHPGLTTEHSPSLSWPLQAVLSCLLYINCTPSASHPDPIMPIHLSGIIGVLWLLSSTR